MEKVATEAHPRCAAVNIGARREITIKDLIGLITELTGFHGSIRGDASKPDVRPPRYLDVSRAQRQFWFRATTSFDEGLRRTIDWHRAQRSS